MTALVEFALFAWVAISVVGVVVQLIRLARYKRSARSTVAAPERAAVSADPPTIDLEQRLANTAPTAAGTAVGSATDESVTSDSATNTSAANTSVTNTSVSDRVADVTAGAPSSMAAGDTITGGRPPTTAAPSSGAPADPPPAPPIADVPDQPDSEAARTDTPPASPEPAPPVPEPVPEPAPATLADLLAGVRLPWNLLPTVDHGREPSNHRVALITDQGEPGQIGVDVADELERLGFTITPRGEDTAIATKEGRSLGLRIVPEPAKAEVDGQRRFPNATEASVALDIWIE